MCVRTHFGVFDGRRVLGVDKLVENEIKFSLVGVGKTP